MLFLSTPFRICNIFRGTFSVIYFCTLPHSTFRWKVPLQICKTHRYYCQTIGFWNKPNSSCPSGHTRDHSSSYISSLSVGSWMWPISGVLISSRVLYKSVVTKSCSSGKLETNDDLLNHILRSVESADLSNGEILNDVERLCKTGSVSAFADLLQFLRRERIFLDSDAYNILLASTSERSDIELSVEIFKDLLVSSKGMSFESYLNLAKAFVNTEDHSRLQELVREVIQLTSHCCVLVVNRMIYAFGECRQIDKALIIFNHMKVLECKPDVVTYNTVIALLGRVGLLDDMLQEFTSMKKANIMPDIVTYNTLLNNLQKFNRLDLCSAYMRELDEIGLILDLRTYTALIESFGRSGNVEEALRLFNAMKRRQVQPSIYIYRSLINNLKKMGKLKNAASLLDEMNSSLPNLVGPKDFKRKNR